MSCIHTKLRENFRLHSEVKLQKKQTRAERGDFIVLDYLRMKIRQEGRERPKKVTTMMLFYLFVKFNNE